AKARMRGRDYACALGEPIEHGRRAFEADARMQEQQRPPAPALDHLHADAVDHDGGALIAGTHQQKSPSPCRAISIPSPSYITLDFAILTHHGGPVPDLSKPVCDIRKNVVYANHDGVELLGDLYLPPGPGPFPVIINVHGGYWR